MLLINIAGLILIALIAWWFWFYQPRGAEALSSEQAIVVANGSYTPARVQIPRDAAYTIRVERKDPSPCAEMLVIPEFDISVELPLNRTIKVELPAMAPGEYAFHCQMQMYKGTLVVE